MKIILVIFLSVFMFAGTAFTQQITNYHYDRGNNLHPLKLVSIAVRPPIAILDVIVRGGYHAIDSEPFRGAFNIEYRPGLDIDSDY